MSPCNARERQMQPRWRRLCATNNYHSLLTGRHDTVLVERQSPPLDKSNAGATRIVEWPNTPMGRRGVLQVPSTVVVIGGVHSTRNR
ncbi:hypothetical protein IG631_14378 [Alternaria alternata]|nr:hypothetical protein IG631_14378 [Alternaria alternata]